MNTPKKYCLDANVFIQGWNEYYSMDLCPSYWDIIDELALEGRIFATDEVRRELEKVDDALWAWVRVRKHLFRDVDMLVQYALRDILKKFPRLVDSTRQRSIADPWVIAHAKTEKAVVVTKEGASDSNKRIKIPDVCRAMNVPCIDDFQFYREIGIRFEARRE